MQMLMELQCTCARHLDRIEVAKHHLKYYSQIPHQPFCINLYLLKVRRVFDS